MNVSRMTMIWFSRFCGDGVSHNGRVPFQPGLFTLFSEKLILQNEPIPFSVPWQPRMAKIWGTLGSGFNWPVVIALNFPPWWTKPPFRKLFPEKINFAERTQLRFVLVVHDVQNLVEVSIGKMRSHYFPPRWTNAPPCHVRRFDNRPPWWKIRGADFFSTMVENLRISALETSICSGPDQWRKYAGVFCEAP